MVDLKFEKPPPSLPKKPPFGEIIRHIFFFPPPSLTIVVVTNDDGLYETIGRSGEKFDSIPRDVPMEGIAFKSNYWSANFPRRCSYAERKVGEAWSGDVWRVEEEEDEEEERKTAGRYHWLFLVERDG